MAIRQSLRLQIYYAFDMESRIENMKSILASAKIARITGLCNLLTSHMEVLPLESLVDTVILDLQSYPKLLLAFASRYHFFTIS